jgi:citrate synthase
MIRKLVVEAIMAQSASTRGLEGVVAAATNISHVFGEEGRLIYRGYDTRELAGHVSFEEVVYLLWEGELPTAEQLEALRANLAAHRSLAPRVRAILRGLPNTAAPMEVLRTVVSVVGVVCRTEQWSPREEAITLTASIPTILAAFDRQRRGLDPIQPRADLSHAANYLYMLSGEVPAEVAASALDTYFVLLADHGMNASTFTARVIASTQSDMTSAIVGAIGALKGPLHGGAPALVLDMLKTIGTPANAEPWMRAALARGERLMGFGHRVYKTEDPRAEILRSLAGRVGDNDLFHLARAAEETGLRLLQEQKPDRRLYTNVEFYSAVVLHAVGLPPDLFTPTFAASRTAGWTAHVLEQYADNRLIRPLSEYRGPQHRTFVPMASR